jgi:predicted metal-dependent peptidase
MGYGKGLDRLSIGRTQLIARCPFFGHLTLKLRPRLVKPGAGVRSAVVAPDGTLLINEDFLDALKPSQVCYLLAHCVLHPALLFFDRKQGRHPKLWNTSHDHAINLIINEMVDAQCEMLPGTILDQRFKNWSAEEIYDDLLKDTVLINLVSDKTGQPDQKPQQKPGQGKKPPQQNKKGQQGRGNLPGLNPYQQQQQNLPPEQQKGPGTSGNDNQDPTQDPLFGDCDEDACDSHEGQKASEGDPASQHRLEQEWKTALVSSLKMHEDEKGQGNLPLGLSRWIDEILEPRIDWKEQLSRWLGENGKRTDYTFQRPSRRSESVGQYMPSQKKYGIAEVTIFMDTSGSIDKVQLKEGCAEVQGICEDLGIGVRVFVIDAAVHQDLKIDDAFELMQNLNGGGGSDFCPGFEVLQKEGYNGVVVAFTDGMITVPTDKPEQLKGCLWVTYQGYKAPTDRWGDHLEIPKEEDAER